MTERKLGPLSQGDQFQIDDGDGDQSYFLERLNLRLINAEWFPGVIPPFGNALLFKVESGRHSGEYLAAVGKGGELVNALTVFGYSGVILFRVINPTATYSDEGRRDLVPLGIAYLHRAL